MLNLGHAHTEVHKLLIEAPVFDRGRYGYRTTAVRHGERVAHQLRAAGLDRVVVGDHAIVPDLVKIIQPALLVDQAVGEAMRGGVQISAGLDIAALGDRLSVSV